MELNSITHVGQWTKVPKISVVIPSFNERNHIVMTVESILNQQPPPGGMEIIIVDGLSNDGTRDILKTVSAAHHDVRIVDNIRRITSCGMNVGITNARGEYVAILGAHCQYAIDYLRSCVALLDEHPEASCVGGPIVSKGTSIFGRAVAAVMSHPVGIGNAKHRHPHYEGYAEGACFPVFRREVFKKIGLYDESLVRNQDDELNYRLTKQGGKVFLSPRARCTYFVRETAGSLFRQYFQYGYWRVAVLRKHRLPASFRQVIPPVFVICLIVALSIGIGVPEWGRFALLGPLIYAGVLAGVGVSFAQQLGWRVAFLVPVAAAILHFAYGVGFGWGLVKRPRRFHALAPSSAEMSRKTGF